MLCPSGNFLEKVLAAVWIERGLGGGIASRAFAEWQRETSLPESGLQSRGWARVKCVLRV
jgi:hypothetical protein